MQVGGKRIGSIQDLALTDTNQAEITIRVEGDVAPLHEGTTAEIRATSLSGAANRYITLVPGPNSGEELDDNAVIASNRTEPIVDIDQLLNALDPTTRKGLQQVTSGFARWYEGKGEEANAGAKYFSPAVSATRRLVAEVARDQGTLVEFLQNTSKTMKAIGERRTELTALVSNTGRTMDAIGSEDAALEQALRFLPGTLRKGNTTFVNLRATLDDLDVLVEESKPATKDLAPLFRELRPLVRDARPVVRDLSKLVRTEGASNDLTDLLRTAPGLARVAEPALEHSREALREAVPNFTLQPPLRPRAHRLAARLRPHGRQLRRQRPLRARGAGLHVARASPTRRRAASCARSRPSSATTASPSASSAAARAAPRSRRATAPRRSPTTARTTATPARCRPGHEARARHRRGAAGRGRARRRGHGRRRGR